MINFFNSSFIWKTKPFSKDPYYCYPGGFVGKSGQAYHVRFKIDATCHVKDKNGNQCELFVGAPCRSEFTIAQSNLFQIPSDEFRMAFSRNCRVLIAKKSSQVHECTVTPLMELFKSYTIELTTCNEIDISNPAQIIEATLTNKQMNARTSYQKDGFNVTVEYPINLININDKDNKFQVCTGPLILPDLNTWDGAEIGRVFLAHGSFNRFDHVEWILRREIEAAPSEKKWLDKTRGRDRFELLDPNNPPPGKPPLRPRPTVFNETWEITAKNQILLYA